MVLVIGFWLLVRLPFQMEDFSRRKANLTQNQKPITQNQAQLFCPISKPFLLYRNTLTFNRIQKR